MTFGNKLTALRPFTVISLFALIGLTGCAQTYDDTKGWGNDVEAWFRKDFLKTVEASIESLEEELAGSGEPAAAQSAPAASPMTDSQMAAKTMPAPAPAPAPQTSRSAPETEVASTAPGIPAVTAKAPAPDSKKVPAPVSSAQENLYPQTAGKPPAEPAMVKTASATPAARTAKPQASAKAAGLALHLSSNKTKDTAMREWAQLKAAFPQQLASLDLEIARTDLGKKGVFYRVMAGRLTDKTAAVRICSELRKKEQYCAVMPAPKPQSQAKTAQINTPG